MNFSPNSAEPFAAQGGMTVPAQAAADPFAELDDLMVVIEALCTEWPSREIFVDGGKMLL